MDNDSHLYEESCGWWWIELPCCPYRKLYLHRSLILAKWQFFYYLEVSMLRSTLAIPVPTIVAFIRNQDK